MAERRIPAWQRAQAPSTVDSSSLSTEQSTPPPPPTPAEPPTTAQQAPGAEESTTSGSTQAQPPLIEQASKFLQDPSIRDAPRERKVAFLQSKGLSSDEIQTLLGPEQAADMPEDASRLWSQNLTPSSPPRQQQPPRDVPPIITYPEFLAKPQKPPPLITIPRLVNAAYTIGGLYTLVYGVSKYLIAPMEASLTDARHDFAVHTQSHLDALNERLSSMVSTIPKGMPSSSGATKDDTDDASSITSDPTELFHRDHGTQTSPALSRRPSTTSLSSAPPRASDPLTSHTNRLAILTSHLSELSSSAAATDSSTADLGTSIEDLRSYLTDLAYASPYYGGGGLYGGYGGEAGKKGDAVEAVKGEVRAVKGVLLSARNFPRVQGRAG
ncbi:hypothetical protein W97_03947 [Coniosporium apollinis CBS 100218]|uniref:Peroxisomal membrane protein PEX14 n=1 Tax=Coniosporium apollinis (strain CBS 100218) TaxID=1168221 RepID=R7YSC2_CONA1|nr:uncharacterized protein W97_03947 [Coniosporium apollinis CBS 100218]EON64714.1 hypothetical protein W97_03947 [Coniosporium apollinis CBS 100218]